MRRLLIHSITVLLVACGGGGGSPAQPVPTPPPAAAAAVQNPVALFGDSLAEHLGSELQAEIPEQVVSDKGVGSTGSSDALRVFKAYAPGGETVVIWTGHNNFDDGPTVLADVAAMASAAPDGRFLVIGLLFGDVDSQHAGSVGHQRKEQLNADMQSQYGIHYIDASALLIAARDPANAQDTTDVQNGITPSTLRSDYLHLNAAGYRIVARAVRDRLTTNGW